MQTESMAARYWTPRHDGAEVLLVTASVRLRDEVARVAAAAGVEVRLLEVQEAGQIPEGSVVVLGSDAAARLPRLAADVIVAGFPDESMLLWEQAAAASAHRVAVLPEAAGWLAEYLSRSRHGDANGSVVAVLGTNGGIGCSTLACWLAADAAARGYASLLVDTDQLGGGLEAGLGWEQVEGLRWPDLAGVRGTVNPAQLRTSLPAARGFSLLGWGHSGAGGEALDIPRQAVSEVMAGAAAGFDIVIVDGGRVRAEAGSWLAVADRAVLLMPAGTRGIAAAAAAADFVRPVRTSAVVRGPLPAGMDEELAAEQAGVELAGYLPRLHGMAAAQDRGRLLERAAHRSVRRLLRRLGPAISPAGTQAG
jgi:secretion/DNA translocation related CpaE-like protein